MEFLIYSSFGVILGLAIGLHVWNHRRKERKAELAAEKAGLRTTDGPRAQHPQIDTDWCIGCGACVTACPEGDVLAVIGGKAALVNGHKCIGHGLCADACPVGAIEIVMASPSMTGNLPSLTPEYETSVENLFVVGELGGLALIKNAINQGRDAVDAIAKRAPALRRRPALGDPPVDVLIVGAGPAGLSASLRAIEKGLSYRTIEAEEFGGTVSKYPRQKLVMTSPVELPIHGPFKKLEVSKEGLLEVWQQAAAKAGLTVQTYEKVEDIVRESCGVFTVKTTKGSYQAHTVILAIGRRGSPNKLNVPGEDQSHVMYSLIDAEAYAGKRLLVVGGGDSAIEAALGLAAQKGNKVVLSYRKGEFTRLKDRNEQKIAEAIRKKTIEVIFNSNPVEILSKSAMLDLGGSRREVPADFVWIFAGGTPPKAFLDRCGIAFGRQDLSAAARTAAAEGEGRWQAA